MTFAARWSHLWKTSWVTWAEMFLAEYRRAESHLHSALPWFEVEPWKWFECSQSAHTSHLQSLRLPASTQRSFLAQTVWSLLHLPLPLLDHLYHLLCWQLVQEITPPRKTVGLQLVTDRKEQIGKSSGSREYHRRYMGENWEDCVWCSCYYYSSSW